MSHPPPGPDPQEAHARECAAEVAAAQRECDSHQAQAKSMMDDHGGTGDVGY